MSWKGNPTNKQRNGKGVNPAPNVRQHNSNLSDIVKDKFQNPDTGTNRYGLNADGVPIESGPGISGGPPVPKIAIYKKEFATRRDLDKTENFNVDLIQIDTTIMDYMNQRLDLSVMDNGTLVKVPVLYASPERWKAVKADGFLRDNQSKILLPLILIKRTNVANNKDLMTFNRYLTYQIMTNYDQKNKYDKFNILNNSNPFKSKPTKQVYNVTLPDHVLITYECILWTDYVDQNNKILEKINYGTHDYWGVDKFRFRTKVDDYTNTVEVGNGEDRNVKTTFTLTVYAYLLPKTIDGVKSTTQKTFTTRKIVVSDYAINSDEMKLIDSINTSKNPYSYLKQGVVVYNTDPVKSMPKQKIAAQVKKTPFRTAPTHSSDYGQDGWLAYDRDYIYVYKKPNGWMRKPISQFDFDSNSGAYISGYDCHNNPIYSTGLRPINTAFRVFQRFPDKFYHQVPYQSSDYGEDGWVSYDGNFFYIFSHDEWRRIPISLVDETF